MYRYYYGLTPLEGLMMGNRSGDIDAGAVTFIMEKEGLNTTGVSNLCEQEERCTRYFRCIKRYA
jgi:acetate kinase